MTVYIDNARHRYGDLMLSHMVADTLEELHAMARSIGVAPVFFSERRHPHYDVCVAKRKLAIEKGAKEVTEREILQLARRAEVNEKRTGGETN